MATELFIGKQLKQVEAHCNFCGETQSKTCIEGSVPFCKIEYKTKKALAIDNWFYKGTGEAGDPKVKVIDGEVKEVEIVYAGFTGEGEHCHICYDCIKKLNNLIP